LAKLPEPPPASRLAGVPPDRKLLASGTALWRCYFRGGRHPTLWNAFRAFGPVETSRFDHHLPPPRPQGRRILYAAEHGPTCIAEVFQATRVIDRTSRDPWLVGFRLLSPLQLLDLTGTWPTRAGASMALSSGPRSRARRWSQAIYEAYPWATGLYYPSSMHGNRPAVALFERAAAGLEPNPTFHRPLGDPALLLLLGEVAHQLGYGLI
jgi:hypothetical protein